MRNALGFHRFNPEIHHRRSLRLQWHDYSLPGYYFLTLCVHDRWLRLLGEIVEGEMVLSEYGRIVDGLVRDLPMRFPDTAIDTHVVMPNHVHMVVRICRCSPVGAIHELPLPENNASPSGRGLRQSAGTAVPEVDKPLPPLQDISSEARRRRRRMMTIPLVMGYLQMNSSKKVNELRNTPGQRLWQRNYYDHIVKDDAELAQIRQYIRNNPLCWTSDRDNPEHRGCGGRKGHLRR